FLDSPRCHQLLLHLPPSFVVLESDAPDQMSREMREMVRRSGSGDEGVVNEPCSVAYLCQQIIDRGLLRAGKGKGVEKGWDSIVTAHDLAKLTAGNAQRLFWMGLR
ncbi:hypothetical protein EON64_18595, partial [archaeon]